MDDAGTGEQVPGVVRSIDPLTVWTAGADDWVPADTLAPVAVGDSVQVTTRGFGRPLVQGAVQV